MEFADSNHILKLTEELSKIENNEVLEIRIMLKQGMLKDVKKLYDNLKIYKNHRINVNVDLLHNMEDKTITPYEEKELEWLKNLS
jgi:competence protein ComGF